MLCGVEPHVMLCERLSADAGWATVRTAAIAVAPTRAAILVRRVRAMAPPGCGVPDDDHIIWLTARRVVTQGERTNTARV
jgi:hypothetical protein